MATATEALRQFVLDPIAKRSPALFLFRLLQLVHERTSGRHDARLRGIAAALKPKIALPPSAMLDDTAVGAAVAELEGRGWSILPYRLPPSDIAEIRAFAAATEAYVDDPQVGVRVDPEAPPGDHARYQWRMRDLLALRAVQRLIADSALHRVAQDYIGCRPLLAHVTMWLDVIHEGVFDAHVYHCDNDGPGFLKYFIYLSDVDVDSGAHTFIQGSHRMKPAQFRTSARCDRDALLAHYGLENEIVFTAPAGTILAEDTAGFHRGMDPKTRPRLLLQLQFSAVDIPHVEEFALGRPTIALPGIDRGIRKIGRKFLA
ncbi:MAG: phytanoyl-CoA dioxygenase family protein [Gemmatimonas sp.]